ncbi:MAG: putative bifunctional diguanylate cyclase/phosphodiesterase [Pseudomonadota bacterium]
MPAHDRKSAPRLSLRVAMANLVTAAAALLMASVLLIAFQLVSLRTSLLEDLRVKARIVGDNLAAAVMFGDQGAAAETLDSLRASPGIVAAAVFDPEGRTVAAYRRGADEPLVAPGAEFAAEDHRFTWHSLDLVQPVEHAGKVIGTVRLRASQEGLYSRLFAYAGTTVLIAAGALAVAFLLVSRMRRAVLRAEERLDYLAYIDPVTNLPNRHAFNERLAYALERADRLGERVALLLLDLDNFKIVNDTLGHHRGDALLAAAAHRLSEGLRHGDGLCRIGGDEFAFVVEGPGASDEAEVVARKTLAALAAPFGVDGHDIYISASVGIACYPNDAADLQTLTRNADTAMYAAKDRGKNAYVRFHSDMDQRAQRRLSVETQLRKALERDEFVVHYQPLYDYRNTRIVGVEALVRWQHPEQGLIPPEDFIAVAEDSGLIVPLGRRVLALACRQARAWQTAGFGPLYVSVNLSARQLRENNFARETIAVLLEAGLSPRLLELEITESVLMENMQAHTLLDELQAAGVRLAIDDFGTGYSSMSYLKRLPIDRLKIDRSFVRDIPGDRDDTAITTAIIAMAHGLGLSVVAEGVETRDQAEFLRVHGCDLMQGYFFSHPVPAGELGELLLRHASPVASVA